MFGFLFLIILILWWKWDNEWCYSNAMKAAERETKRQEKRRKYEELIEQRKNIRGNREKKQANNIYNIFCMGCSGFA